MTCICVVLQVTKYLLGVLVELFKQRVARILTSDLKTRKTWQSLKRKSWINTTDISMVIEKSLLINLLKITF